MDRTVTVWGKPHAVKVSQWSRTAWCANGIYEGKPLIGRGATASAALASWSAAAKTVRKT